MRITNKIGQPIYMLDWYGDVHSNTIYTTEVSLIKATTGIPSLSSPAQRYVSRTTIGL